MSFSFLDSFTGGAVSSNALTGHVPDLTSGGAALVATVQAAHMGFSGGGIFYNTYTTYPGSSDFVTAVLTMPAALPVVDTTITQFQGWSAGGSMSLPKSDSGTALQLIFHDATATTCNAILQVSVPQTGGTFTATSTYASFTYANTGPLFILRSTNNTTVNGTLKLMFYQPVGLGPYDINVHCTGLSTSLSVNGVTVLTFPHQTAFPSVNDVNMSLLAGTGMDSFAMSASGNAAFWHDFVKTYEVI